MQVLVLKCYVHYFTPCNVLWALASVNCRHWTPSFRWCFSKYFTISWGWQSFRWVSAPALGWVRRSSEGVCSLNVYLNAEGAELIIKEHAASCFILTAYRSNHFWRQAYRFPLSMLWVSVNVKVNLLGRFFICAWCWVIKSEPPWFADTSVMHLKPLICFTAGWAKKNSSFHWACLKPLDGCAPRLNFTPAAFLYFLCWMPEMTAMVWW